MKSLLLFLLLLASTATFAHQADLSTTLLVERADGKWELHLVASLTAFQYEVQTHYGKDAYATPEAFQDLVVEHLQRTVAVRFGGGEAVVLTPIQVALGHETKVAFALANVPGDFTKIEVTNTAFADIYHNQSALVILKPGTEKQQFELTAENGHTAALTLRDGRMYELSPLQASLAPNSPAVVLSLSVLVLGGLAYYGYHRSGQHA